MRIAEKDTAVIIQPSTATDRVVIGFFVLAFSCVVIAAAARFISSSLILQGKQFRLMNVRTSVLEKR